MKLIFKLQIARRIDAEDDFDAQEKPIDKSKSE